MSGWVKLTKEFTNDDLWFNTSAFRLYVWILLKASYRDGHMINGVELKKGQYIRAFSELGKDLMYIEGRSKKVLAKSTVKRAVDKLVKKGLLEVEETPLGTKFTIVNFDQFKCLEATSDFFCPPYRETETERKDVQGETEVEQKKEFGNEIDILKLQDSSRYPGQQTEDVKEIVEFWDANGFGFTNVNAKQQLLSWLDDSRFLQPKAMILKAMNIACANNKRKLNYITGILKNWENESLLTVEDIDSYDENRKPAPSKRKLSESPSVGRAIPSRFTLDLTAGEE